MLDLFGSAGRDTCRFSVPQDVLFDEGSTARQHVVIEDSEKPKDEEIVNTGRNDGENAKKIVPDSSIPSTRPLEPPKLFKLPEMSQTPVEPIGPPDSRSLSHLDHLGTRNARPYATRTVVTPYLRAIRRYSIVPSYLERNRAVLRRKNRPKTSKTHLGL